MAERSPSPVFPDTTVVSNFASTDGLGFLTTVLEPPVVVPTVRDEIERGERAGYEYLGVAVDALGESLPIREVPSIGLSCLVSNASRSTAKRLTSGSMGGANTEGTTRRSRA